MSGFGIMNLNDFSRLVDARNVEKRLVKWAYKQLRAPLQKEAKHNATTYPMRRTGNLYRSIKAFVNSDQSRLWVSLQAGNETAFYAKFVERGTIHMAPRYYLKRARDMVVNDLDQKIKNQLNIHFKKRVEI